MHIYEFCEHFRTVFGVILCPQNFLNVKKKYTQKYPLILLSIYAFSKNNLSYGLDSYFRSSKLWVWGLIKSIEFVYSIVTIFYKFYSQVTISLMLLNIYIWQQIYNSTDYFFVWKDGLNHNLQYVHDCDFFIKISRDFTVRVSTN